MEKKYTHFTNFGVSIQPQEAGPEGYLEYREGYESLNKKEWTLAERWISIKNEEIAEWRRGS